MGGFSMGKEKENEEAKLNCTFLNCTSGGLTGGGCLKCQPQANEASGLLAGTNRTMRIAPLGHQEIRYE